MGVVSGNMDQVVAKTLDSIGGLPSGKPNATRGMARLTYGPLRCRPCHTSRVRTSPKVESHQKSQYDSARDGERRCADSSGSGDSQPLISQSLAGGTGHQYQHGEADYSADSRTRGDDSCGNTLLAICHTGGRGDEHRGEHNAVADTERDKAWDKHGVGAVRRHRETHRDSTDCTDGECGDKGALD